MKTLLIPCFLLMTLACGSPESPPKSQAKMVWKDVDTCFYEVNCGPDLDMPQTPAWDTTIVRKTGCDVECFVMRSWGTETQYGMSGPDGASGSCHFTHGAEGTNLIDITGMPSGDYYFSLSACGNGGAFTVHVK